MLKKIKTNFIIFILLLILSAFLINYISFDMNDFVVLYKLFTTQNFPSIINSPLFWKSGIGLLCKFLIQCFTITILLAIWFYAVEQKFRFKALFTQIAVCFSVYIVQMWLDFLLKYFSSNGYSFTNEFSFFSIKSFLGLIGITNYNSIFNYAFNSITLFDLFFAFALFFSARKYYAMPKNKAFISVLTAYVLPLFIWTLFITYLFLR